MSLISELKNTKLATNIGEFEFVKQIGQGGNALVCEFKKDKVHFAIKFLEHIDQKKINRFIDEYFCATQAGGHKNIAPSYHLDTVIIKEKTYSIIIMKLFDCNLKSQGSIHQLNDKEKSIKGWHLAKCILTGLRHLHSNGIVHRDIKPENILHSAEDNNYAIADLGIAHFSADYPKEALTKSGERLSNYHCSPMDQIDGKSAPTPAWDLFAFGQVMNWYLFNDYIRGDGKVTYNGDDLKLKILDKIIKKCVQNNPSNRFSSIDEIKDSYNKQLNAKRDVWQRLHDFDLAVRSSLPTMSTFYETSNKTEINRFLTSFSEKCRLDEFWYITDEAGDFDLNTFEKIDNDRWLLGGNYELKIEKLLVYKNSSLHKSLFILFTEKDSPFDYFDCNGKK
ncbi:protein kinase domain-containing protein [Chromobacterium vaccinii]|uniref:protein kinase domain-containing protein n=1 Tax=Chromobacterium vaccinii TaxID=1108595 RepID=UPI001E3C22A3|nr:protein kinase [Chromobacterium vaccinii]MCD4500152.1 protein kinase [Chromobacterium vaccinii]